MIILFLFFLFSFVQSVQAVDVAPEYDGVTFAVYTLDGRPIWHEEDKQQILKESNTSTRTYVDSDFVPVLPSTATINLVTQFYGLPLRTGKTWQPALKADDVKTLIENPQVVLLDVTVKAQTIVSKGVLTDSDTAIVSDLTAKASLLTTYIQTIPVEAIPETP